jgi:hypothetical protein
MYVLLLRVLADGRHMIALGVTAATTAAAALTSVVTDSSGTVVAACASVAAIASSLTAVVSWRSRAHIQQLSINIDGRMENLIETARALGAADAVAAAAPVATAWEAAPPPTTQRPPDLPTSTT